MDTVWVVEEVTFGGREVLLVGATRAAATEALKEHYRRQEVTWADDAHQPDTVVGRFAAVAGQSSAYIGVFTLTEFYLAP